MPPEFSEQSHKPTKAHSAGAPPPEQEQIPCPRCDSINTKFCYYNNYNFSQPRYFCKSCRRYWTQGGTLRDIPFGGGSRKNAKRSRTSTATGTIVSNSASLMDYPPLTTVLVPLSDDSDVKANTVGGLGSFSSLLTTPGAGFLALGGFGFTNGLEGLGFGHERAIWPFPAMSGGAGTYAGGTGVEDTWKLKN